jgi:fibronectin type 3 domain-containing protein
MRLRLLGIWLSVGVLGISLAGCDVETPKASTERGGSHSVTLTWDASESVISGYRVYRGTNPNEPPTLLTVTAPDTTRYRDTFVEAGQTYFYVVTAFDSARRESVQSNRVVATIPTQ